MAGENSSSTSSWFSNPWLEAAAAVVLWTTMWVGIEVLLFDGDARSAAIVGAFSGLVFAAARAALRRYAPT